MKFLLQSCGLDSTAAALILLDGSKDMVQPIHVNYGGKTNKEGKILREALWPLINNRFPNYLKPVTLRMKKCNIEDRNLQMIELVKEHFSYLGIDKIYTGIMIPGNRFPADTDVDILSRKSGISVVGLKSKTKEQLLNAVVRRGDPMMIKILRATSSCQVWFKRHCGQCFSCVKRFSAFHNVFGDRIEDMDVMFPDRLKNKLGI
jgi:7-cyano-7-deazaguanine synthase in queuosine biosynthesis